MDEHNMCLELETAMLPKDFYDHIPRIIPVKFHYNRVKKIIFNVHGLKFCTGALLVHFEGFK
jgi:hypothetical protein